MWTRQDQQALEDRERNPHLYPHQYQRNPEEVETPWACAKCGKDQPFHNRWR